VKLTTHLQLVLDSRIYAAIYPLTHTSSWRSAQLAKHKNKFTFTGYYYVYDRNGDYRQCLSFPATAELFNVDVHDMSAFPPVSLVVANLNQYT
jgi:hypothetical protein